MKVRQLKVLEQILSYGIGIFINGLKLRFISHLPISESKSQTISTLIDKIDNELKDVPETLFENAKMVSGVYHKVLKHYEFDKPEQLFGSAHNILEESLVLTLRYATICEALEVIPANYPTNQKQALEKSLKIIEVESKEIQKIFTKINDFSLAKAVHDSIVILNATEQNISIEKADSNQQRKWS